MDSVCDTEDDDLKIHAYATEEQCLEDIGTFSAGLALWDSVCKDRGNKIVLKLIMD